MVRTRPLASHAATSAADRASTRHKRLDKQALLNNTTPSLLKAPKVSKSSRTKPPPGYTFLSVGYPDLAEKCRELSSTQKVDFRQISASKNTKADKIAGQLHRIGYHIRTDIFDDACQKLGYRIENGKLTKDSYAQSIQGFERAFGRFGIDVAQETAQKASEEDARKVKATIRELFPYIPEDEANQIFSRAWQKGSQNIGRAEHVPMARRVQLAVAAHIRHQHTDYDHLLASKSVSWLEARHNVEQACLRKLIEWRGEDPNESLDEEFQGVLEHTLVFSGDELPAEQSEPDRYADNEDSSEGEIVVEENPARLAEYERPPSAFGNARNAYGNGSGPHSRPRPSFDDGKRRSAVLAKYQQARQQPRPPSQLQHPQHPLPHVPYQAHSSYPPAPSSQHAGAPGYPQYRVEDRTPYHVEDYVRLQSPLYATSTPQPYHPTTASYHSHYPPPPQPPNIYHNQPEYHPSLAAPPPPPPTYQRPEYGHPPAHQHMPPPSAPHRQPAPNPPPIQDIAPQRFHDENGREILIDPTTHELVPLFEEETDHFRPTIAAPPALTAPTTVGFSRSIMAPNTHSRAMTIASSSHDDVVDDDDAYEPPSAIPPVSHQQLRPSKRARKQDLEISSHQRPSGGQHPPANSQTSEHLAPHRTALPSKASSKKEKKAARRERAAREKKARKQAIKQPATVELSYDDEDDDEEYDPSQPVVQTSHHSSRPAVERNPPTPQYYVPPPPPPLPPQSVPIFDRRHVAATPIPQHGAPALIQPSHRSQPPPPMPVMQYPPHPQHYQVVPPPLPPPPPQYYHSQMPGYEAYYQR
ncbi:hypothetical protein B9Z65_2512 [Elsinoe australis]|uniref:DUF2293 domain-containing protein n=1 Tax=Elsinoe australis TaxID=40998 RepID=A0A2P7ZAX9_9PEZI|nr:hypothetical protein B9Z65_2512 [Elsinoe australis]